MDPINLITGINKEMISDINFDWFGKRLAVATVDKIIKIYNIFTDEQGRVTLQKIGEPINLQNGGILWKIKWAHPDFGSIIAVCSYDKHIIVRRTKEKEYKGNQR